MANNVHSRVERFVTAAPAWIHHYADQADVSGLNPIATGWFCLGFPIEYTGSIGFQLERNGVAHKTTVDITTMKTAEEVQAWADQAIRTLLGI